MNLILALCAVGLLEGIKCFNVEDDYTLLPRSNRIYRFGAFDAEISTEFILYTRHHKEHGEILERKKSSILNSKFNASWPTRFVVHGFLSSGLGKSCQLIKNAYLEKGDYNVIIVNWGSLSESLIGFYKYSVVATSIRHVGMVLGQFATLLNGLTGASFDNMYIIGHSLGAHIAGFAGQYVQSSIPSKIFRAIFGLDPAGPAFVSLELELRLSSDDAQYVESIQTNAYGWLKTFGIPLNIGNASFYVNFGYRQPNCMMITCSHSRAFEYFAESINSERNFHGKQCANLTEIANKQCSSLNDEAVIMGGEPLKMKSAGIFYVRTSSSYPYAMGPLDPLDYMNIKVFNANNTNGHRFTAEDLVSGKNKNYLNPMIPVRFLICDFTIVSVVEAYMICSQIKDAYLEKGDFNILIFDWHGIIVEGLYNRGIFDNDIGRSIANIAKHLTNAYGIPYDNIDLVGEGIGASYASLAGEKIFPNKFNAIFALDYEGDLKEDSANYIESIQTSSLRHNGHATIFVNYGGYHPTCWFRSKTCTHTTAIEIFISSLLKDNLKAAPLICNNLEKITENSCTSSGNHYEDFGGIKSERKLHGVYKLIITNPNDLMGLNMLSKIRNIFPFGK